MNSAKNELNCSINLTIGHYDWCTKTGGHFLTDISTSSKLFTIEATIPMKFINADSIRVIGNKSGFEYHYNTHTRRLFYYRAFFDADNYFNGSCDTKFIVRLGKWKPRNPDALPLSRSEYDTLYEVIIDIPTLNILNTECSGDAKHLKCPICNNELEEDSHVSTCGHAFHHNCILKLLESQDRTYYSNCYRCPHKFKTDYIDCPYCDEIL